MTRIVKVLRADRLSYIKGIALQKYISSQQFHNAGNQANEQENFENVLILTEHNPVYTIGIRTKSYTDEDENNLRKLGAEFYKTNRGGLITFHGPGQLVAYPILHLKQFTPSIRWYVGQLEKTIINLCRQFKIDAETTKDTGIWVKNKKICAIGIHCSRYITSHGIGLNCNTDLSWFDHIVPCGIPGKGVTSLSNELKQNIDLNTVIPRFLHCFGEEFNCELVEFNNNDKVKFLECI